MASPEMSVICSVLNPDMEHMMNLGVLLIHHFRRQRATISGKNTWVLSPEEFHALRGWDDFGQDHQYQQPPQQSYMQQQPGYDYVPREEYDTLVGRVGDVESMLQYVNSNVLSLTQSFSEFSTHFQTYYPPPHGVAGGQ
ncbi:hypothetical protein QYE76_024973 [Lolium multiflorum]|uniref:Uncharacterized protein n=1 Tax=Lolium multiflorum TaxID=4521 RepID=A0AAD8REQ9_LOLMU|nr:hypothetical protein QYE76_024973 [Lolium multiflorum]